MTRRLLAAAAVLAGVAACGRGASAADPPAVPWGDYSAGVHEQIDADDCAGLADAAQGQIVTTGVEQRKYGHDNVAILDYITWRMTQLGCESTPTESPTSTAISRTVPLPWFG